MNLEHISDEFSINLPHQASLFFTLSVTILNNQMASLSSCKRFSLSEMKALTNEFAAQNFVGSGGFGTVYRSNDRRLAVKRLNKVSQQRDADFEKEIKLVSICHHKNIVSFVGYCDEDDEKILVFELMRKGSLYHCLYDDKTSFLDVKTRLGIILQVAYGLKYLHFHPSFIIIHSDLKTDNILIDDDWIAKITDFGLSRTRAASQYVTEQILSGVKGTTGYIAPECYNENYAPSRKADVYAFGMVFLELLCEKRAWEGLAAYALPTVEKGGLLGIMVPTVKMNITPECSKACERLIKDCCQNQPAKRPPMSRVVTVLESALKLQMEYEKGMNQNTNEDRQTKQDQASRVLPRTDPKVFSSRNDLLVLYYTTSQVIAQTYHKSQDIRRILNEYGKRVDERDLRCCPSYKHQLRSIFGELEYTLPQLFIGGEHVGGADEIEELHWSRKLKEKLEWLPNRDYPLVCNECQSTRFVVCLKGNCEECNQNGYLPCPNCCVWKAN